MEHKNKGEKPARKGVENTKGEKREGLCGLQLVLLIHILHREKERKANQKHKTPNICVVQTENTATKIKQQTLSR